MSGPGQQQRLARHMGPGLLGLMDPTSVFLSTDHSTRPRPRCVSEGLFPFLPPSWAVSTRGNKETGLGFSDRPAVHAQDRPLPAPAASLRGSCPCPGAPTLQCWGGLRTSRGDRSGRGAQLPLPLLQSAVPCLAGGCGPGVGAEGLPAPRAAEQRDLAETPQCPAPCPPVPVRLHPFPLHHNMSNLR